MLSEREKRRTFAIISHPDAGKTTLTEKLLLFGGAIQLAGTVKGRKSNRHAKSDWMELEKQRGISVTSAVMQFPYRERIVNLLDTPGHEDFSEDTYRVLTAVDSALMVIDVAKGVEERTIKLMEVCRLRQTPIFTFINKLDREGRDPLELLDEVESVLKIRCAPVTYPIGMGHNFKGIYHLYEDAIYLFEKGRNAEMQQALRIEGIDNPEVDLRLESQADELREAVELVRGASASFAPAAYLRGEITPVFFGSAISNFGVQQLLDGFIEFAPAPLPRQAKERQVAPNEEKFSGFVFKIQANMDPGHRDRIAFVRICSGMFNKGMKVQHVRLNREMKWPDALTFMAAEREHVEQAYAGDIIGIHNHGTLRIGDSFTEGENLQFQGIPHFAPELFRRAMLKDPLRLKALQKGLQQLCEEGATQLYKPMQSNDLILGAVGILQFDVVAFRLRDEYGVECQFETVNIHTARWLQAKDEKTLATFIEKYAGQLAYDHAETLVYLAPSRVNLQMAIEKNPDITFSAIRDI